MRPANGSVGMQGTVSERRRRDRERARTRNKRGEHQYPTTTLNEINVIITSPSQLRDCKLKIEKLNNVVNCVIYNSCNYREIYFY